MVNSTTDKIDQVRLQYLKSIASSMREFLGKYSSHEYICRDDTSASAECGAIMFGTLSRELALKGFTTSSSAPYNGMSLEDLSNSIAILRSPRWTSIDYRYKPHSCTLDKVKLAVREAVERVQGLDLKDFPNR
jgi:hypothetical protein